MTAPGEVEPGTRLGRLAPRSFRGRIVASTVALMAVAMVAVGLILQLLLGVAAQREINQVLHDRANAAIGVIQRASVHGLTVPPDSLEPGVDVFDRHGDLVAGSVEKEVRDAARDLATTRSASTKEGPEGRERLLGVPFATPSGDAGVVVISQETAPYERSEFYALLATGALAILVTGVTAAIALLVTRQALAPVRQMAERAADWSEHDLSHRFDLGPPTHELAALGETLDRLLDRVASAILSEQRLTAELAHELRTPLTAIRGSADLALLRGVRDPEERGDLEQISRSAREMTGVIATLLDLAREGTAGQHDRTCVVEDVVVALVAAVPHEVLVDVGTIHSTARVAAPVELVVRAISPVLENAVRHARSRVTLVARDRAECVELLVGDDGPGVADEVRESLFEPGVSGRVDGAGLGLGIARRVARSFGGDVAVVPDTTGATFLVTLPRR